MDVSKYDLMNTNKSAGASCSKRLYYIILLPPASHETVYIYIIFFVWFIQIQIYEYNNLFLKGFYTYFYIVWPLTWKKEISSRSFASLRLRDHLRRHSMDGLIYKDWRTWHLYKKKEQSLSLFQEHHISVLNWSTLAYYYHLVFTIRIFLSLVS